MNFMIIDDSSTMRKIIGLALKSDGHSFIEAENGKDAIIKSDTNNVDFFIVDYNMPELNGIEFIKEIRKKTTYNKTPIIILTTEADDKLIDEGKTAGADAWIVKPFEKDKFLNVINDVSKKS